MSYLFFSLVKVWASHGNFSLINRSSYKRSILAAVNIVMKRFPKRTDLHDQIGQLLFSNMPIWLVPELRKLHPKGPRSLMFSFLFKSDRPWDVTYFLILGPDYEPNGRLFPAAGSVFKFFLICRWVRIIFWLIIIHRELENDQDAIL